MCGTFAEDIEIVSCTGECHVEQVEVIYHVLQMLMMIVWLIDALFHLTGTKIHWYSGNSLYGYPAACTRWYSTSPVASRSKA